MGPASEPQHPALPALFPGRPGQPAEGGSDIVMPGSLEMLEERPWHGKGAVPSPGLAADSAKAPLCPRLVGNAGDARGRQLGGLKDPRSDRLYLGL